jgi:hypothetical protein
MESMGKIFLLLHILPVNLKFLESWEKSCRARREKIVGAEILALITP